MKQRVQLPYGCPNCKPKGLFKKSYKGFTIELVKAYKYDDSGCVTGDFTCPRCHKSWRRISASHAFPEDHIKEIYFNYGGMGIYTMQSCSACGVRFSKATFSPLHEECWEPDSNEPCRACGDTRPE